MKILVTGATGFIGRQILQLLRERNHDIVVLTRNLESAGVRLPIACRTVQWNPHAGSLDPDIFAGVEAVIHLAGENIAGGRWTSRRKRELHRSRILSTRCLVDALKGIERKPAVFISASAIGFYGDRGNESLREDSLAGEGFLAELCRDWEHEVFQAESLGIRPVALRLGMVLGPNGGAMKMMLPPFRLGLGGRLGNGRQWMGWIHVQDVARLFIHALEKNSLRGPVNAVAPHPLSNRDFTRTLGEVLGLPAIIPVPETVLRFLFGSLAQLVLVSQKVSADKALESGFKFEYPDLASALQAVCEINYHEFVMEQWVPHSIDKVFAFFANAKNLEVVMPPFLKFKITGTSAKTLEAGTRLDYRLELRGIPFRWQSIITDFQPVKRFSDKQTRGPYSFWHHTHEFEEKEGGTLIRDRAEYAIPFASLTDVFMHGLVRKDLETIFSFRRKKIEELFGPR